VDLENTSYEVQMLISIETDGSEHDKRLTGTVTVLETYFVRDSCFLSFSDAGILNTCWRFNFAIGMACF
jgi:hypothetical protein